MRQVKLGNRVIGDGHPTFIIAEMACSHDGSVDKAKRIIRGAAEAKADAINFQVFSIEDLMVPQYGSGKARVSAGKESLPIFDYLKTISFGPQIWEQLFIYARERNLLIISVCGDLPSIELVSDLKPDAYTVSAPSLCEEKYVKKIAAKMKPVFIRTGGAFLGEIEKAIMWINECGNSDIILLHGFQNYPTKLEDMHLRYIQSLKQVFSLPVGIAEHTDAESSLALVVPLVALAFGANVIEKHITHDRSLKGIDFESALDPEGLRNLVQNLRQVEKAFGSPAVRPFSGAEADYRQSVKKRTVARNTLAKGERITSDKITFKRSDEGVYPDESQYLIERRVNTKIEKDEPITWDRIS
jgi:sialic acid synthase SpsE